MERAEGPGPFSSWTVNPIEPMKTNIEYERSEGGLSVFIRIDGASTLASAVAEIQELCKAFNQDSMPASHGVRPQGQRPPRNGNHFKCTLPQFISWLRGNGPLKKHEARFRSMERFGFRRSKFYNLWAEALDAGSLEKVGDRWQVKP